MIMYAPFKFFIVDERDMYTVQPTLINNTDEKVGLQIEHSKDFFLQKTNKQTKINLEATDRSGNHCFRYV